VKTSCFPLLPVRFTQYQLSVSLKLVMLSTRDYEQAKFNAPKGTQPLLFCKANHKEPVVIVNAEWFVKNILKGRK
jgi:hypothetical protein